MLSTVVALGQSDGSVRIVDAGTGNDLASFRPLDANGKQYDSVVAVALGDVTGDGIDDLFVAAQKRANVSGLDASKAGRVFVYDGVNLLNGTVTAGDFIDTFQPFATPFGGGINPDGTTAYQTGFELATGDVNGDGVLDLVAASRGDVGQIAVQSTAAGHAVIGGVVTPFGPNYRGKVSITAGNVIPDTGTENDEIAAARGNTDSIISSQVGTSTRAAIYDLVGNTLSQITFSGAIAPDGTPGSIQGAGGQVIDRNAFVATVNTGTGSDLLLFAARDFVSDPSNPQIRIAVYGVGANGSTTLQSSNAAGSGSYTVGTQVVSYALTASDLDGDGVDSVAVAIDGSPDGVLYLNPLTGAETGRLSVGIPGGGLRVAGSMIGEPPVNEPSAIAPATLLAWNDLLLTAVKTDASAPPVATRAMAMLNLAMYDVQGGFVGRPGYLVTLTAPTDADPTAAAAEAASRVLTYLYPAQQAAFEAERDRQLATTPAGAARDAGVAYGQAIADAIIAARRDDGAEQFTDYTPGTELGAWERTPPMFAEEQLPEWATVQPFALSTPSEFRPAAPPAVGSEAWLTAFNEVRDLGSAARVRNPNSDEAQLPRLWADGAGTNTPPGHWLQIALAGAQERNLDGATTARMLAALSVAFADSSVAAWDAKYTYGTWRPVTAINNADQLNDPNITPDSSWLPLLITPNHPEYVSGHSTYSRAAATVLERFLPGYSFSTTATALGMTVTRTYASFDAAANDAGRSRVLGGIHFEFSNAAGQTLGRAVANRVLATFAQTDNFGPEVTFTTVSGQPQDTGTVTGRVNDAQSGVASLTAGVVGEIPVDVPLDATGNFTFTPTLPGDGTFTIRFTATDVAGNVSTTDYQLVFDGTDPIVTITAPSDGANVDGAADLTGTVDGTGADIVSLTYQLDEAGLPVMPIPFDPAGGAFTIPLNLAWVSLGSRIVTVTATDAAGNITTTQRSFNLTAQPDLVVASVLPLDGATDVGVTYRPRVMFSRPVVSVSDQNIYAVDAAGVRIATNPVLSDDGSFARVFFPNELPGSSTVTLIIDGNGDDANPNDDIVGTSDFAVLAGGATQEVRFTTVSRTADPSLGVQPFVNGVFVEGGTAGSTVTGIVADPGPDLLPGTPDDVKAGPDGRLLTADDIYVLPLAGVKVFALGRENFPVTTDANGRFTLAVPAGPVKLAIDGRTATNGAAGVFFPEMVMDLVIEPGLENTVMGSMGTGDQQRANEFLEGVYLPRLLDNMMTTVGATGAVIGTPAETATRLTAEERDRITLTVPAGTTMLNANGNQTGANKIGISVVPVELVREMLPPGVPAGMVETAITIQAPGIETFGAPLPLTMPNTSGAAPGTKLNLFSFDHTTGRLEIEGTMTVSADGLTMTTDPGSGITHPGWHGGLLPGAVGSGGGAGPRTPRRPGEGGTHPGGNTLEPPADEPQDCSWWDFGFRAASAVIRAGRLTAEYFAFLGPYKCLLSAADNVNQLASQVARAVADASDGKPLACSAVRGLTATAEATLGILLDCVFQKPDIDSLLKKVRDDLSRVDAILSELGSLSRLAECLGVSASSVTDSIAGIQGWYRTLRPLAEQELELADPVSSLTRVVRQMIVELRNLACDGGATDPVDIPPRTYASITDADVGLQDTAPRLAGLDAAAVAENEAAFAGVLDTSRTFGPRIYDEVIGHSGGPSTGPQLYRAVNLETGDATRGSLAGGETFQTLALAAQARYQIDYYDLDSGWAGTTLIVTGLPGSRVTLPVALLAPTEPDDADADGLSAEAEAIVGTNPTKADTDGDGIADFAELQAGTDPLGGRPAVTGVLGRLPITVNGSPVAVHSVTDAGTTALLATGNHGLAVVDVGDPVQPTVLGLIDLPGFNTDVAFDPDLNLAVVASQIDGLHVVDVTDPARPTLQHTFLGRFATVEVRDSIAYAGSTQFVRAYDLLGVGGPDLDVVDLGTSIIDMTRDGRFLYAMTDQRRLFVIDIGGSTMTIRGSVQLQFGGGKLAAGSGLVYAAAASRNQGGYATIDVTDPDNPQIISESDVPVTVSSVGAAVGTTGSGLALVVGRTNTGINALDLIDSRDPTNTGGFLTRFVLPGTPSDVAVGNGVGYVATDTAGLTVVNYRSADTADQSPTVSISLPGVTNNTAEEGSAVDVLAIIEDDVQVRAVELLIGGQVFRTDTSFPFDLSAILPVIAANGGNAATVQVRATDTGGNIGLSNVVTVTLTPDTTLPTLVSNTLVDGPYPPDLGPIRLTFSESINPATLSADTIRLVGPSGAVAAEEFRIVRRGTIAQLEYPTLPPGTYQLIIQAAAVRDQVGNPLGVSDLTTTIRVGTVVVQDSFDTENGGIDTGNFNNFTNWVVTRGGVDLQPTQAFVYPYSGLQIDLDGTDSQAGRLESRVAFDLQPGTYALVFWLGYNPGYFFERTGEVNTFDLSVGTVYAETITRTTEVPPRSEIIRREFVVAAGQSANLVFDHQGGDFYGLTIDNVFLLRLS